MGWLQKAAAAAPKAEAAPAQAAPQVAPRSASPSPAAGGGGATAATLLGMQGNAAGNGAAQSTLAAASPAPVSSSGVCTAAEAPSSDAAELDRTDVGEGPVRDLLEWVFGYEEDSLRSQLGGTPPPVEEVREPDWERLPDAMVGSHDNGVGDEEQKWVNDQGQEVILSTDTGALEVVTDPEYAGTFNYVNAVAWDWGRFVADPSFLNDFTFGNLGHLTFDLAPYEAARAENWIEQKVADTTTGALDWLRDQGSRMGGLGV